MTKYRVPIKKNGRLLARNSFKLDPDFVQALRIFAKLETDREGLKISQATVLTTLALKGSSELRQIYKQLKRERNSEISKK